MVAWLEKKRRGEFYIQSAKQKSIITLCNYGQRTRGRHCKHQHSGKQMRTLHGEGRTARRQSDLRSREHDQIRASLSTRGNSAVTKTAEAAATICPLTHVVWGTTKAYSTESLRPLLEKERSFPPFMKQRERAKKREGQPNERTRLCGPQNGKRPDEINLRRGEEASTHSGKLLLSHEKICLKKCTHA